MERENCLIISLVIQQVGVQRVRRDVACSAAGGQETRRSPIRTTQMRGRGSSGRDAEWNSESAAIWNSKIEVPRLRKMALQQPRVKSVVNVSSEKNSLPSRNEKASLRITPCAARRSRFYRTKFIP
jgi:hypothetical protein